MAWGLMDQFWGMFSPEAWHSFSPPESNKAMAAMPEVPLAAVGAYLVMVFGGQYVMKNRDPIAAKPLFRLWNFLLAAFSIFGTYKVVPTFVAVVLSTPHSELLCGKPLDVFFTGDVGFWKLTFMLSKFPELIDTFWLVIQKKPVIFLHWYHHVTVLLYCWYSWLEFVPPDTWFCVMNYTVHSVMYSYYFLTTFESLRFVRKLGNYITMAQIAQMVVGFGIAISGLVAVYVQGRRDCTWKQSNMVACGLMYASYFLLFARFFVNKKSKTKKSKTA
jgi:elongation of very long chain fatty acids protein 6